MRVRGIEAERKGAGTCDIDWRGTLGSCRQQRGGEERCGQGKQEKKKTPCFRT